LNFEVGLLDLFRRFSKKSEGKDDEKVALEFERKFGCPFRNHNILIEALTHRSYIRSNGSSQPSNERLEYLGDSVLGLVTAEHLYSLFPEYDEGDLTKAKALLVNEMTLSQVGRESGLNEFIFLSADEERAGGRDRPSIISDTVEAVIGAIYLDSGLIAARTFVSRILFSHSRDIFTDTSMRNYKGDLLEYQQSQGKAPPIYEVVSETGPDHDKTFNVVVYTDGVITGSGSGASKKEAEQKAASVSLKSLLDKDKKES